MLFVVRLADLDRVALRMLRHNGGGEDAYSVALNIRSVPELSDVRIYSLCRRT